MKRFFLFSFIFLLPSFLIWHSLAPVIALPIGWVIQKIFITFWPVLFSGIEINESAIFIQMALGDLTGKILPEAVAGNRLAFNIDTRLVTYALPFFSSLYLALPAGSFYNHIAGLVSLWILCIPTTLIVCLKEVLVIIGPEFFQKIVVFPPDLIVFFYQFSVLLFPTLGPIVGLGLLISFQNASKKPLGS